MDAKEAADMIEQTVARLHEQTPNDMIDAAEDLVRQEIYNRYYYAKPDVVEALLLMQRRFLEHVYAEINDIDSKEAVLSAEDPIIAQCDRFSEVLWETLDALYDV